MSGVQGPLETRVKTTVETTAVLSGLDATPFDSGELAYVRATRQTFLLSREDISVVDGTTVLAVGPTGAVGRWLLQSGSAPSGGSILYYAQLDPLNSPVVVPTGTTVTVVSKVFVAPTDGDYFLIGTATFAGVLTDLPPAEFESCEFDLVVDGNFVESGIGTSTNQVVSQQLIRSYPDSVAAQGAVHLSAGQHTVEWQATAAAPLDVEVFTADLSIQPFGTIDAVP